MILGTLCYIRKNNSTLLLHRTKKKNDSMADYWIGLGGKIDIEKGETPHENIIREVKEESGLTVTPQLRGIITFYNEENDQDDWYAYVFSAHNFSGKLIESDEGNLQWIQDKEIENINLLEGDRMFLQWLKENKPLFSAKFVYKNKELLKHEVVFY